ncbi:MAG: phosphodiester glycosidase family protein, partial [Armatimonadota bacterium]|nr:phosphodiester glycosidase family protein [Armatimonadota bacterium]
MRQVLFAAVVLVLATCMTCTAEDTWEVLIPGDPVPAVRHLHRVTSDPLNIHVLIIDLTNPRVRIRAGLKNDNDKPDDGETVRSICSRYNAVAAINCDYFAFSADPWNNFRHIPQGHNMTDGLLMLPPGRTSPIVPDRTAIAFPSNNSYAVVGIFMTPQQWWYNVAAGGPRIIRNGVVGWEVEPDIPDQTSRQPRTGAAVSADYKTLILAVVDGRQPSSRGMTANELGYLLKEFGGYNGLSFDGGGSTTMVINGVTVNSPSDGTDRRIANCLMVLDRARQGDGDVLFESSFDPPVYLRGALSGQDGWTGGGTVGFGGRGDTRCAVFRNGGALRAVSNAPASGIWYFEYWMKFSSNNATAYVSAGTAGLASTACAIRLIGGQLEAYDTDQFGTPVWVSLASCAPNTWYRVGVRLDYYIRRYQVFVNGALKLSGASFQDASAGSGLQCIKFEETGGAADFCVDDIYVGGAEPDYLRISPDSVTMVAGARLRFRAMGGLPPVTWRIVDE